MAPDDGTASAEAALSAADAAGELTDGGRQRGEAEVAAPRLSPVYLVRNVRRVQGVGRGAFRRSLAAVPGYFFRTTVVTRRLFLPVGMGGAESRRPLGLGVRPTNGGGSVGSAGRVGRTAASGGTGEGSAGNGGESVSRSFVGWPPPRPLPSPKADEEASGNDKQE